MSTQWLLCGPMSTQLVLCGHMSAQNTMYGQVCWFPQALGHIGPANIQAFPDGW